MEPETSKKECACEEGTKDGEDPCSECETNPESQKYEIILAKLQSWSQSRYSWVTLMLFLGAADMAFKWLCYFNLADSAWAYGIIIGPVPEIHRILLLAFTVVMSVLYLFETLNTVSALWNEGLTVFPLAYEQIITVGVAQSPIAAINYFISNCRNVYSTNLQTLCGTIMIVYIFFRMIWHAHLEGKFMRKEGNLRVAKHWFMLVCTLFAVAMAFPVMIWRFMPSLTLSQKALGDVSIFLLKVPLEFQTGQVVDRNIDSILERQGRDLKHPYIVANIYHIIELENEVYNATYLCRGNATYQPIECEEGGYLKFKFLFSKKDAINPYGEIHYNFAYVNPNITSSPIINNNNNQTGCVTSTENLQKGFRLYFFQTALYTQRRVHHVNVTRAWNSCITPKAVYNPEIPVCKDFH